MNAKQLFAAAAFAVIGTSAFAVEAEQFVPPTGSLTRAEVRAELARAQASGEIAAVSANYGDFTVAKGARSIDQAKLSREAVRTEASSALRNGQNALYIGG